MSEQQAVSAGESFKVELAGFSGPLDLLCHLVESHEFDAVQVRLVDLIGQYVRFVLDSGRASLSEVAEFFSLASRLLLGKVRALFPSNDEAEKDEEFLPLEDEEEVLLGALERYRPYRRAAQHLALLQAARERSFLRVTDDDETFPYYDLGDLFGLARLWWQILERHNRRLRERSPGSDYLSREIPDAVPEERLVEQRMEEIAGQMEEGARVSLKSILRERSWGHVIVTLLALLELSRLGRVRIFQAEAGSEVDVEWALGA